MYTRQIKQTIILATPMIVGQIGQLAMSVTDNIMVGRLGTDELAAAGIGNGLFILVMVTGIGISMAVTPLTAIAMGAGRDKECGVILRQGLLLNMITGVILCLVTFLGAQSIRVLAQSAGCHCGTGRCLYGSSGAVHVAVNALSILSPVRRRRKLS